MLNSFTKQLCEYPPEVLNLAIILPKALNAAFEVSFTVKTYQDADASKHQDIYIYQHTPSLDSHT